MVTELQKRAAQAIVNVFETGHPQGDYGEVTLLPGDTGHLTYGRSQTTLASGNLHLLIKAYCEIDGSEYGAAVREYLDRLASRDTTLDDDMTFRRLLQQAGGDPVMREVQDQFFDRVYWDPSVRSAEVIGISTGLGTSVVYDSCIHGSWRRIRDRSNERHGLARDIGERTWINHYVNERREWLANHPNALLHRTVYRMEAFRQLISEDNWDLQLPFRVRGILIDESVLSATTPIRASAHDQDERTLRLQSPYMQGDDVREVQRALADAGFTVSVDGIFGPQMEGAVKRFQQQRDLKVDGIVGPATRSALGIF